MSVSTSNDELRFYDEAYWAEREAAMEATRARIASSRMEVQSFFALSGQSTREDYHRAAADLYGMQPTFPGWSNGYTTFDKLAFALNHVVNEAEGQVVTEYRTVVLESQHFPVGLWMLLPLKGAQAVANLMAFLAGRPYEIPPWRIEKAEAGQQVLSSLNGTTRPAKRGERCVRILVEMQVERVTEERRVESTHPAEPVWANPYQIDGGFTILADSMERSFKRPGVEGLSVLRDSSGRMHIVYWITDAFPHTRIGRNGKAYTSDRVAKKPLAVHSLAIPTTEEDALEEMRRIEDAMVRTSAYLDDPIQHSLLPWQAAEMAAGPDAPSTSAPMLYGSHEWLTTVADQLASGETYRSKGAGPDA